MKSTGYHIRSTRNGSRHDQESRGLHGEVAEGRIEIASGRLTDVFPYHAAVLERIKLVARADLDTMAVTVSGDDVVIYYNPEFVLAITADELGGVLLHETHHVVFRHVLADPADFPDSWARTVAEEVTVNEFVNLPLPGEPITLDRVPNLPPLESTRQRYNRLKRVQQRGSIGLPQGPSAGAHGGPGGTPRGGPSSGGGGPSADTPAATPAGGVRRGAGRRRDRPRPAASVGHTLDDHDVWAEARQDPDRSRRAIRKVLRGALEEVGPHAVPASLMPELEALGLGQMEAGAGTVAGGCEEALQEHRSGRLDWRQLLHRYVGQAVDERPVFNHLCWFPHLVGVVPGVSRQASRPRVLAVIDSSGSLSAGSLELIDAELAGLARRHEVTVVECDRVIQRVYKHRGRLETVQGRGGTDLCPPLNLGAACTARTS